MFTTKETSQNESRRRFASRRSYLGQPKEATWGCQTSIAAGFPLAVRRGISIIDQLQPHILNGFKKQL